MSTSMDTTATSVTSSASSMVSGLNLVANAVTAIASIFSAIELAHTNTLLARIEESTRRTDITMEGAVVTQLQKLDLLQAMSDNLFHIVSSTYNTMVEIGAVPAIMTAMLAQMGAMVAGLSNESSMNPVLIQLISQINGLLGGLTGYNPTPTGGVGSARINPAD